MQTRAVFVYSIAGQYKAAQTAGEPLYALADFGRFTPHLRASSGLLPRILLAKDASTVSFGGPEELTLDRAHVVATVSPRGDVTLVLDVLVPADVEYEAITKLLRETCFRRAELSIDNVPILSWVTREIDPNGKFLAEPLKFASDVHQMVFPGGAFLEQVRVAHMSDMDGVPPLVAQLIYRGAQGIAAGVHMPPALNNPGHTLLAHGRGVSIAAGWGPQVADWSLHLENTFVVLVTVLMSALGVVQRVRRQAFATLALNESSMLESTEDARELISELSADLNEMQLDLSFGVEAYVDSVLIPESVVERFQHSLRVATGLDEGLTNTSRMLDRLQSVIQARLSTLEAAMGEQTERSNRVFSGVVAIGTLIALPPALLLAFFGINGTEVIDQRSIFNLPVYWPAYLVAWLPFVVLVVAGFVLQRRIRASSPHLRKQHNARPRSDS